MIKKYFLSVLFLLLCEKVDSSVELAQGKPASSNGYISPWSASNAVDGNTNTNLKCNSCLHTSYQTPAYLKINLRSRHTINRVVIYYPLSWPSSCADTSVNTEMIEKFQKRFIRSSIRTSTKNTIWGIRCYVENTPIEDFKDFNLIQNVSCHATAQYVSLVQYQISQEPDVTQPVLAVCEMKIYGCPIGYYGVNCERKCSDQCMNGKCDPDLGCLQCSTDELKGPDCLSECLAYTYGDSCEKICGNCRDNAICDEENGHCPDDMCQQGYKGSLCKEECNPGKYSYNCNETCGFCLKAQPCDKQNGSCPNACSPGYKGSTCKTECEPGLYGYNCNETCGNCLHNETCERKQGNCSVCEDGYIYPLCKEQCPNGSYGFHCNENCGHCFGGEQCHWKSGICPNGCELGYYGSTCKTECQHGFYSYSCNETCGNCLGNESCDNQFGNCSICEPGFKSSLCKLTCDKGRYGQNCEEYCGHCRNGKACNHITGLCGDEGCDKGFVGPLCKEACSSSTFGYNCKENCGFCINNNACDVFFGNCSACQNGYIEPYCNVRNLEQESSSTPVIGATAGAIALVVLVILGILFIVIRRKRRMNKPEKSYFEGIPDRNVTETGFSNKDGRSCVYINVQDVNEEIDEEDREIEEQQYANVELKPVDENSYNINVDELLTVIQRKSSNENAGFIAEFQHLPKGQLKPCTHAEKAENRLKNRFKSTFPYDDTRVCLERSAEEESDYINANIITNLEGKKAYIACQGPKNHTIIDTWRMIWQENVSQIVMLTNLKEKNVMKCSKYWPEVNMSVTHGSFNISNVEERKYANYTITNLSVYHSQKKERRVLTHFQYTTWPDHGVPDAINLIAFHCRVKRVQSMTKTTAFPLLVHCSAGIGRTGTFIALDALSEHCKHTKTINVFQYIKRIREQDRMNMIQTADQYAAVHELLYESLRTQSYPIPRDKLSEKVNKMCSPSVPVNQNILRTQLMELNKMKPAYSDKDFTGGFQNQHLNVDPKILPVDRFRVYLSSYAKGRSDYINAVTVPTQKDEKGIIVTNFPSSTNTVDFLRLLVDHGAILVSLEVVNTAEKGWVQRLSNADIDPYAVELCCNTVSTTCNFEESEMNILNKKDAHSYKFPVFETTAWTTKYTDDKSLSLITSLIQAVMDIRNRTKGEGKIIVASKDGLTGCDVFCAVYNAMEQLELDSEVDMFNIVRQIQIRRPQFIPTMDEYTLCLKSAANVPLPRENIYANL